MAAADFPFSQNYGSTASPMGRNEPGLHSTVKLAVGMVMLQFCAGCPAPLATAVPVRSDSAGIEIVTYSSSRELTNTLAFEPRAYFALGGSKANPRDELDSKMGGFLVLEREDGLFVVNDRHRVMYYDSSGAVVRTAGREGDGPGEFRSIASICMVPGDSLLVYGGDVPQLLDDKGSFVRLVPEVHNFFYCTDSGRVVVGRRGPRAAAGADHDPASSFPYGHYAVLDWKGDTTVDLGRLPMFTFRNLFVRPVHLIFRGGMVYVGDSKAFEVREQTTDGRVVRILRVNDKVRLMARNSAPVMAPSSDNARAGDIEMPAPALGETYPAYYAVDVDPAGRVWIGLDDDLKQWLIFGPDLGFLGRLRLPSASPFRSPERVAVRAGTYFVIDKRDSDGMPLLAFYRLAAPK